jgi:OPA family glycerol-3-phosphate transporter-like MFS transporter
MTTDWIMLALLVVVVGIYFKDNPMKHASDYRWRCFFNWFPLGMTYAFLYMARYNLTVAKTALGTLMSKEDFGIIFAAGTWTYGVSFIINGPLIDKIGGKLGMLIGTAGSAVSNILMGVALYMFLAGGTTLDLTLTFAILYSINMYFQSYGAVSIVKVNAPWFHVKERGMFGGIFGTLISLGLYFAYDWGQFIVKATRALKPGEVGEGWLRPLLESCFGSSPIGQTWFVFFIPAAILIVWVILDIFLIKDYPSQAGYEDFETGDASAGQMDKPVTVWQIIYRVVTNPIILTIAIIEFCSGVVRNGLMNWYFIFSDEMQYESAQFFYKNWGLLTCFAGVLGGFLAGFISDKLFQSRRGPSSAMFYLLILAGSMVMTLVLFSQQIVLGVTVLLMMLGVIGVHGMLSGTATMDFGGRKGAATAVGIIDGFVYLGTGLQALGIGMLVGGKSSNWIYWPLFLIPFAVIGLLLSLTIWKALPNAVRKSH